MNPLNMLKRYYLLNKSGYKSEAKAVIYKLLLATRKQLDPKRLP